jgi:hypothetical protein
LRLGQKEIFKTKFGIIASFNDEAMIPKVGALADAGLTSVRFYLISTFTSFDGGR